MQTEASQNSTLLVTGSSGFIGTHLCSTLLKAPIKGRALCGLDLVPSPSPGSYPEYKADIRLGGELGEAARGGHPGALVHLAAKAEVQIPYGSYGDLLSTNVEGTFNVLNTFRPRLCIFASTSSVYGNTPAKGGLPRWSHVRPLGIYGLSKATGELICREWARETGSSAVILRLGNVVGANCRGLIPYLVNHARAYPDGSVAAELRGEGLLERDYIPVQHIVSIMSKALERPWGHGKSFVFNVGTGRGMTNREVVERVCSVLKSYGYTMRINWHNPVVPGEARVAVLDPGATERTFGIARPSHDNVIQAIEEATRSFLP